MATCNEYVVVPTLPSDPCNGERGNIKCQFSEDAYTLLDVPANSSLDVILNAMVLAINAQNTLINAQALIIADLEARVEILEAV